MIEILIILGLILLNGIFAMAEIALISSRKIRLEAQANKGDKKAMEALKLANHPDAFISTTQIGITLIGILNGIFSGEHIKNDLVDFFSKFHLTAPYSNGVATTVVVIIVTYFSLVLGELVPKKIGLSNPEGIAKMFARPMRVITQISYPFVWLLTKSGNFIINLLKIKNKDSNVTEDEIKAIINVKNLDDKDFVSGHNIVLCTKKGVIKKTTLSDFSRPRTTGVNAITILEGDELLDAMLAGRKDTEE